MCCSDRLRSPPKAVIRYDKVIEAERKLALQNKVKPKELFEGEHYKAKNKFFANGYSSSTFWIKRL